MESSEASQDRFLLVICPGCKEPLYPPREQGGTKIACPCCGKQVLVPKPKPSEEPHPQAAPKEYGIHDPDYVARPVEYIKLACPTCRTLLYAEPERVGEKITCPDCYTKVKVRRGEQHTPRKPEAEKIGGYQVLEDGAKSKVGDDHFLFVCPTCNARLHPSRKLVGKRVRCPDCKEVLVVPAAPDRKETRRPAAVEAYGLEQEGSESKRLGPEHYFSHSCPRCSARLRALRTSAGEKIDCPDCGVRIRVPAAPELRVQKSRPWWPGSRPSSTKPCRGRRCASPSGRTPSRIASRWPNLRGGRSSAACSAFPGAAMRSLVGGCSRWDWRRPACWPRLACR